MRALVFVAAICSSLAARAGADEGSTIAFLGSETTWRDARLSLHDVSQFHRSGAHVHVGGAGRVVVRRMLGDGRERRHDVTIAAQEARALIRLACEVDLIRVPVPDHPGVPDETRPLIVLSNARGGVYMIDKWANDAVPRWDRLFVALDSLARTVEERREPVHEGAWDDGWTWTPALPTIRVISYDRTTSGGGRGRGVDLTDSGDVAAVCERLRQLPASNRPVPATGRSYWISEHGVELWISAQGVEGFPSGGVQVGAGTVRIAGAELQDARGLEDFLRARLRAARVVLPADDGG